MNQKRSPLSKMVNTFFRFGEGKLFVQQVCASIPCPVKPALLCTIGSDLFIKDPLQVGVLDGSSDITEQVIISTWTPKEPQKKVQQPLIRSMFRRLHIHDADGLLTLFL